jgi:signal transduction histidine kinase/ActR/RegA family two-component response regulator
MDLMAYSWTPGAILPLLSVLCVGTSALVAWRSKRVAATKPFMALQVGALIWCMAYALELCSTNVNQAVFFTDIEYIGITFLPPASAWFALVYSDRVRKPSSLGWFVLSLQPATVLPLVWINPGDIFRRATHMEQIGGHYLLAFDPGPVYLYNVILAHLFMAYAWGTFFYLALHRSNAFRKQARMLFVAFVLPVIGNVLYRSGVGPVVHYDITPSIFSICGLITTYSLFRLSFLELAPIARGTIVEQMVDPVLVVNTRGRLVDFNRAASHVLDLAPEVLVGQDAHKLLQASGRFTGSNVGSGALYHHRDRIFAVKRSPLNDPYRGEIGQVLHFSDMTERLELEGRLKAAKDEADAASRAKSNFLANMSHEIRTPMNGVIGLSDLLEETPLSERQLQYTHAIQSCSRSLMHIIDEILDFSKIEAGKMTLNPEALELISLLRDVTIAHRVIAEGKQLHFEVDLPDCAGIPVFADASAIRQVLNNLIGNAIKFTSTGFVRVHLEDLGDDCFAFDVEDSGIGIADEKLAAVFDRFSQGDESTTRQFGGTGLGLTITKQLITMMGGQISVDSDQGVGSRFRVELPLPRALLSQAEDASSEALNLRVLLAEDNLVNTMVIEHQLDQLGCITTHCADGRAAVEAFKLGHFDVALLDVQMPIMDGIETCRQLRVVERTRMPIVALTANALERERERCLEVGMNAFLTKPTTVKQLRETLYRVTHTVQS